jgi:DNA repair exonuclease SbcCD ATPase subunit
MADSTLTLNRESLREAFGQWQTEQEALEAEWNESLAALAAYQSHLDGWQKELAGERDALRRERQAWEREQAEAKAAWEQSSSQAGTQLTEAREKIALLSQQLVARTEELRLLDQRRGELTTELEVARAQCRDLSADVDEQKQRLERERAAWTEQLKQMRELLELRAAAPVTGYDDVEPTGVQPQAAQPVEAAPRPARPSVGQRPSPNSHNPVLGSIMEQFGKLRQQRANDRQTGKKPR